MSDSFWNPGDQFLVWALNVVLQVGLVAALAMLIGLTMCAQKERESWFCLADQPQDLPNCPVKSSADWKSLPVVSGHIL